MEGRCEVELAVADTLDDDRELDAMVVGVLARKRGQHHRLRPMVDKLLSCIRALVL